MLRVIFNLAMTRIIELVLTDDSPNLVNDTAEVIRDSGLKLRSIREKGSPKLTPKNTPNVNELLGVFFKS